MPRGKQKSTAINKPSSIQDSKTDVKIDPEDQPVETKSMLDLHQFKFEKKPHIRIEYEKESPTKEEGQGLWEPANWRDFLLNLRNMRSNNDAPVDSMGCHMAMDQKAPPKVMRYQSLLALMLSSQTKDQVTFAAMERLRAHGCTVENILETSDEELGKLIYPVGFWKTKVKYIKKTTQTLKEQYDGDIPDSVEKLCKLTGVGPKMAHICMKVAWDKVTGIGVDTHVHRISNRIGWVKKTTTTPEDTRKDLQSWLPFELWSEVNHLMVGFGQTICQPISPLCHECLNNDICPSSGLGRKSPNKSPKKTPIKRELRVSSGDDKPLVSPKKSPKKTPIKKGPRDSGDDFESLMPETVNGRITPKKEAVKETNVKKVAPRKQVVNVEKLEVDESVKTDKSLSSKTAPKRKVTPKKQIDNSNEGQDKLVVSNKAQTKKKKTPSKENVVVRETRNRKVK